MSKRLEGKVALVTGTGGGQGRAAAAKFAEEGALIVGCDLNDEGNRETVAIVEAAGGTMTGMAPVDLSDPETAKSVGGGSGRRPRTDRRALQQRLLSEVRADAGNVG